jgi:hypothetical protein
VSKSRGIRTRGSGRHHRIPHVQPEPVQLWELPIPARGVCTTSARRLKNHMHHGVRKTEAGGRVPWYSKQQCRCRGRSPLLGMAISRQSGPSLPHLLSTRGHVGVTGCRPRPRVFTRTACRRRRWSHSATTRSRSAVILRKSRSDGRACSRWSNRRKPSRTS